MAKPKLPTISDESWNEWRTTIGNVTKEKVIVKSLIDNGVDMDPIIELLGADRPPQWIAQCYYDAARSVFGESPGFLLVWLTFLEWRKAMSAGDSKYKLYPAERGAKQELSRLLTLTGGKPGEPPSKDVIQVAASYVATSIVHQWAGLPRKEWMERVKPVQLTSPTEKKKGTSRWNELVKHITDNGVAPAWAKLSELDAMNLAVALATGDKPTIEEYHTRVNEVVPNGN